MNITVDNRTIFRIMGVIVTFVLSLYFIYLTRQALILIGVAFFLALALNPSVSYLSHRLPGESRGVATALAYLVVVGALTALIWLSVPQLVNQTNNFIQNFPDYAAELKDGDSFAAQLVDSFGLEQQIDELQANFDSDQLTAASDPVFGFLQRVSSSVLSVLTVFVLTFFMLVEGPSWLKRFWALHPPEHRQHRQQLAQRMYRVVTGYVNGQLLIASIAATSALAALVTLNVLGFEIPFILPLAALVGILGLIPLIGATLGASVVVVVAMFSSVSAAVIMLIFFIVYQQVENNVLQPIVQSKSVNMSPLLIFISAIIGVNLSGLLGAIVAIPVAASAKILLNDYIERHLAHDKPKTKQA